MNPLRFGQMLKSIMAHQRFILNPVYLPLWTIHTFGYRSSQVLLKLLVTGLLQEMDFLLITMIAYFPLTAQQTAVFWHLC